MWDENPEIECPECEGEGWVGKRLPRLGGGVHEVNCEHCNGRGWRAMTQDEQHRAAWEQKQELKR